MSGIHPRHPDPVIPLVAAPTERDEPASGRLPVDSDGYSPLALGCATFGYGIYSPAPSTPEQLALPVRTVRLALAYGITVFDTSPHYHPSEIVLGNALSALAAEHPRESYKLISKCGRYNSDGFDYSPINIEASVRRSLKRLQSGYLDCVYLHDVEFVCSRMPALQKTNRPLSFLKPEGQALAGLRLGSSPGTTTDRPASLGEGDDIILGAWAVLVRLRDEGLIREIGISGYPLPCLLRLSHLLSPPPSSILSYSHSNLQNEAFGHYAPHFPRGCRLLTASPLNMGLLVPSGAPDWHPALSDPKNASILPVSREAAEVAADWSGGLPDVALGYGLRNISLSDNGKQGVVPVVVGAKNPDEVHQAVRIWREVNESGRDDAARREMERKVRDVWVLGGWEDVSWESPSRTTI